MIKFLPSIRFWSAVCGSLLSGVVWAQTVDAPPVVSVGDKWTYRFHNIADKREPYLFTNEVKSLDGESAWIYADSMDPGAQPAKSIWRMDLRRAEFVERFEFDPAAQNAAGKPLVDRRANDISLQFPLAVGKKYKVKQNYDNGTGFTEYNAEVEAMEKVKVEAGEFDTYRIKYTGFWTTRAGRSFSGRSELTRWYAPVVKAFVKSEFSNRTTDFQPWNHNKTELVKFEAGK